MAAVGIALLSLGLSIAAFTVALISITRKG